LNVAPHVAPVMKHEDRAYTGVPPVKQYIKTSSAPKKRGTENGGSGPYRFQGSAEGCRTLNALEQPGGK
jgi:hypothetical protein